MKRTLTITATLAALAATTASAHAAQVTLSLDTSKSELTKGVLLPNKQPAFQAPYTSLKFTAQAVNDAGGPVLNAQGRSAGATVDLIARTADGDKVVDSETIWDTQPVSFDLQFLQENTTYFARLNPSPEGGVASPTDSNALPFKAVLRSYPNGYYSRYLNTLSLSGFYSRSETTTARAAVRVLIQRKAGSRWKTLRTLRPNARREWRTKLRVGRIPAVFRVRTVPVNPKRFIAISDYSHCVASSQAAAKRLCKAVGPDPRG
ncbi:MAG: hypothetical protein KDC33_04050 [Thermoleophilia bacterium]|nr:hypothetical protein [Thermoleophilia bacterium]